MSVEAQVRYRLQNQVYFNPWRKYTHELRKLVAGDMSSISAEHNQQRADDAPGDEKPGYPNSDGYDYYDILAVDVQSGRTNKLLQYVRTLVNQTAYRMPDFDIEDGEAIEAMAIQGYLKARLGPRPRGCGWVEQARITELNYLIGGLGWSAVTFDERQNLQIVSLDPLDVTFDMNAKIPQDIKWYSHRCRRPLHQWLEIYGRAPFKEYLEDDKATLDQRVTLEYYYDIEGDEGAHYVFNCDKLESKPIYRGPNPFFLEDQGFRRPYLNAVPMAFLSLPSVRFPMSLVQMMLPHQLALWLTERYMRDTIQRGAPFYEGEKGALDEKAKKEFLAGNIGSYVERGEQKLPLTQHPPLEIPQTVHAFHMKNDQDLTAQSGVNPYASGDKVEGIKYASEVNAIQSSSDLMASTTGKDLAAHSTAVVKVFLAAAAQFDDMPCTIRIDKTELALGPQMPPKLFIRPDMDLVVSEDAMQFTSRRERVQMAREELQDALAMAGAAPNAPLKAYEKLLRATGEKDVQAWLEPPAAPMGMGSTQQAAEAQASVA